MNHSQTELLHTLQRFEENAYSLVLKAFRAQGVLNETKIHLLENLRDCLHVTKEHHEEEWDRVEKDPFIQKLAENKFFVLRDAFTGNVVSPPPDEEFLQPTDENIIRFAFTSQTRQEKQERKSPEPKKRTREFQSITENSKYIKTETPHEITGLQDHIEHEIVQVNDLDKQIESCQDSNKKLELLEKRVIKLKHISRSLDILENRIDLQELQ